MAMVLISLFVFGLVMILMAVGVLLGKKPIKGSCGGLGSLGLGQACDICGGTRVESAMDEPSEASLADSDKLYYDAMK